MTRPTPDTTPPTKPKTTRAEAYASIARVLKGMSNDQERRAVLASIATLYEPVA